MMTERNLEVFGDNIWIAAGKTVPFYSLPYSTRMVVVRIPNDELLIYSPVDLVPSVKSALDELGQVKYLIAPNLLHHLFLPEWQAAYPDAKTYGTAGVIKKRADIRFDAELKNGESYPWSQELDHVLFTGSPAMEEALFFHHQSSTLLVADFVENFLPEAFNPVQRFVARITGILAPNGKMPIDWRFSFLFGKHQARGHFKTVLNWHPRQLVMAHGEPVKRDAEDFLRRSFRWLGG